MRQPHGHTRRGGLQLVDATPVSGDVDFNLTREERAELLAEADGRETEAEVN